MKYNPCEWYAKGNLVCEHLGNSRTIATVGLLWNYSNHEEAEEYARLVAAAPEMLVACRGALVALQLGQHVDQEAAIKYLREVLAKADPPQSVNPPQ